LNIAEKLSREVARVTTLRENYIQCAREFGEHKAGLALAIGAMHIALEGGHRAAGSNDAEVVLSALNDLEGYTE